MWRLVFVIFAFTMAIVPAHADLYRAGPQLDVAGPVEGDAVLAGGQVTVAGPVSGSVLAVGGLVEIKDQVREAVRAAAGRVDIAAQIGGDLTAAGGSIRLAPGAHVNGEAWLAGGHVDIAGWTAGNVRVAAGSVVITGEVLGDADLTAGSIVIGAGAIIHGRLIDRGIDPVRVDPGARIDGAIIRTALPVPDMSRIGAGIATFFRIAWMVGLILTGLVLVGFFPRLTIEAARTLARAPGRSLLLGFAIAVATPFAIVLAMVSLLGIPFAFALLALYGLSLVIGYLIAAFFLGDLALRLIGRNETESLLWRLASLVIALIALAVLHNMPWIGGLIFLAALLSGLGAWYLRLWERYNIA